MAHVNISGMSGGEIIGVGVSGAGNVIGREVTVSGTIQVGAATLERIPDAYAAGLTAFTENVNRELEAVQASPEQVAAVQEAVEELAAEAAELQPEEPADWKRKRGLGTALRAVAQGLLRVLPQGARTLAALTPLAPFAGLIGEGLEAIVAEVQGAG
jgi:hypothetical protein